MNKIKSHYRKYNSIACLFLVLCLWSTQAQVDEDRFLVPAESVWDGTGFISSGPRVLAPDALPHRILRISEKAADHLRSGSSLHQNTRNVLDIVRSAFLLYAMKCKQVYMSYSRHLRFFHILIRYIHNQNGL